MNKDIVSFTFIRYSSCIWNSGVLTYEISWSGTSGIYSCHCPILLIFLLVVRLEVVIIRLYHTAADCVSTYLLLLLSMVAKSLQKSDNPICHIFTHQL